ncbi:VOC family protein [Streptobacillus felis]|uniref:VOC family protein n=1 Tax=Streptobacillus felis TaxID=1384509 RepID=UPI00082C8BCD|nr:VOC family protein [Streptobacillus felis]
MIKSLGQIMIYVENTTESMKFWTEKVGLVLLETMENDENISYVIAPKLDSEVKLVLHDKEWVRSINPEINLRTPSILMESENIKKTYHEFIEKGINVNPVVDLGFMKTFNFSDN